MHVRATMRLCNNAVLAVLLTGAALTLPAQQKPTTQPLPAQGASAPRGASTPRGASPAPAASQPQYAPAQAPSLTEDRDPVRSPDVAAPETGNGPLQKKGEGYVLRADVEEVVLNCTVLDGSKLVQDLKGENFQVFEDGVKQNVRSEEHTSELQSRQYLVC